MTKYWPVKTIVCQKNALVLMHCILSKKNSAKITEEISLKSFRILNAYMAQISKLAKLPSETALILYWDTVAALWPAVQQIQQHSDKTIMAVLVKNALELLEIITF